MGLINCSRIKFKRIFSSLESIISFGMPHNSVKRLFVFIILLFLSTAKIPSFVDSKITLRFSSLSFINFSFFILLKAIPNDIAIFSKKWIISSVNWFVRLSFSWRMPIVSSLLIKGIKATD